MKPFMYKLMLGLFIVLGLPAYAADTGNFQEGTNYQRLATPVPTSTDGKVEVVEVFWYGCPHCFKLDPIIENWLKHKPDNVSFVRIPAVLGKAWEPAARAFYAAETLNVLDKIHTPLMNAIHVQRRPLANEQQLADFFAEQGVDKEAFLKAYHSFDVETRLRRSEQLVSRYGIEGVPTVVVNGKYVVTGTLAGSTEGMFDVVDYLIKQESKTG